jgi:malonyl CoA-acyl carrier protein transacylase/phosphopantetheinyl transferase
MSMNAPAAGESELFVVRGDDRAHLAERIATLSKYVADLGRDAPLGDLAYTLNCSMDEGDARLAIVAGTADELLARLQRAAERLAQDNCTQIRDVSGIYYFAEPLTRQGTLALLFPGEGAQYLGMLDGLTARFPSVEAVYDACDRAAAEHGHDKRPTSRFTLPRAHWSEGELAELEQDLRRIDNAMFSVFMASWAVYHVLELMGVAPAAVAGHSAGELAALVVAGVHNPEQNIGPLGRAMADLAAHGDSGCSLLAVGASRGVLADVITASLAGNDALKACVAMDNCPHQAIAVGESNAIGKVQAEAARRGLMCEQLSLGRPYHTRWFEPSMGPLRELFAAIEFRSPHSPVYSCTTGERFPSDPDAIRELALAHWCSPVEFTRLVRNLHRDGVRLFLEVGPRNNLTSFVDDILRGEPHLAVPSNVPHRSAVLHLQHMAAQLAAQHVPLQLDCFYEHRAVELVDWEPAPAKSRAVPPREAPVKSEATTGPSRNAIVQNHLAIANQFLDLQTEVMQQFLRRRGNQSLGSARRRGDSTNGIDVGHPPTVRTARPSPTLDRSRAPLLGGVLEHVPQKRLLVRRSLDLQEDNYAAHHTVGGRSISKVDPDQHGLPIMPMTFTLEMMMEAAAALLPGLKVLGVKNVRLSRWLAFHDDDCGAIQLSATVLDGAPADMLAEASRQVLVEVKDLGRTSEQRDDQSWLAAVGTVVLGEAYPQPPIADEFPISNERPCRTDIPTTYNNLFHGELLQGFESVERFGDDGIVGTVRTLPQNDLFASHEAPQFIGDPVLLDVAMHPAVAWHLEQPDQSGRIMLPFELQRLELYGPMPAAGTVFQSRTRIAEETHWHYTHVTEVYDGAGRLWGKIDGIKLWRFYLPFHDVNFHGPKDVYFLSEEWPEAAPRPANPQLDAKPMCCCVRLRELNDLKQPALQLVGARVMLSSAELKHFLALDRPANKKAEWLFGRAAAKDAIRILQRKRHGERPFMADVEIFADDFGRPVARPRGRKRPEDYPHVSIAHAAGHIVALAAASPHVGIDIESIVSREAGFEDIAFDESERGLLDEFADRDEWIARFWCAKEAVGKALGRGLLGGPRGLIVRAADAASGLIEVELGNSLAEEFPALREVRVNAMTWREDDLVVATTLCEPVPNSAMQARSS